MRRVLRLSAGPGFLLLAGLPVPVALARGGEGQFGGGHPGGGRFGGGGFGGPRGGVHRGGFAGRPGFRYGGFYGYAGPYYGSNPWCVYHPDACS